MLNKKIAPFGDRLLVEVLEEEEIRPSGIIIPEVAREKPQRGIVVAAGKGRIDPDGQVVPLLAQVGDEILFGKYVGSDVSMGDNKKYLMMREDDAMGRLEDIEEPNS